MQHKSPSSLTMMGLAVIRDLKRFKWKGSKERIQWNLPGDLYGEREKWKKSQLTRRKWQGNSALYGVVFLTRRFCIHVLRNFRSSEYLLEEINLNQK